MAMCSRKPGDRVDVRFRPQPPRGSGLGRRWPVRQLPLTLSVSSVECRIRELVREGCLGGPDFGEPGSASDPDDALLEFVDGGLFALPVEGYMAQGRDEDRRLYTYSVNDQAKVAVIVADSANVPVSVEDGWAVKTFASCDPAECDPAADDQIPIKIWLDSDGDRVPTSIVTSSRFGTTWTDQGWSSSVAYVMSSGNSSVSSTSPWRSASIASSISATWSSMNPPVVT